MATATKNKPIARLGDKPVEKPKSKKGSQFTPWTEAELQILKDAVASSPTASAGFKVAAEKLGKAPNAVSQKWYIMKAKEKTQKAPKASPKAKATPVAPKAAHGQKSMHKWMTGQIADIDAKIADLNGRKQSYQSVINQFEKATR